MSRNKITFIPVGGLANRMRAIDAAIGLAQETNSTLLIIWYKDQGLNCRFDELFCPLSIPNVELREATIPDLLIYDRPRQKNLWIPRLFQRFLFDGCIYEKSVTPLLRAHFNFFSWATEKRNIYFSSYTDFYPQRKNKPFSAFHPLPALIKEINTYCSGFDKSTIGIHIRRTDNLISITESPTELFTKRMKHEIEINKQTRFYLATDSETEKQQLKELFGEYITTSPFKATRNSVIGIQNALVELYILSRTSRIIGSMQSSYSEVAAQINNISCELLKKE